MITDEIVEGWTEPLTFELDDLLVAGQAPVPTNLAGKTVTLSLAGADGTVINTSAKVQVIDEAAGKVEYTPGATDLKAIQSPYRARFKVVSGLVVVFYPAKSPFTLLVTPVV